MNHAMKIFWTHTILVITYWIYEIRKVLHGELHLTYKKPF